MARSERKNKRKVGASEWECIIPKKSQDLNFYVQVKGELQVLGKDFDNKYCSECLQRPILASFRSRASLLILLQCLLLALMGH